MDVVEFEAGRDSELCEGKGVLHKQKYFPSKSTVSTDDPKVGHLKPCAWTGPAKEVTLIPTSHLVRIVHIGKSTPYPATRQ